jgi:hypothetical protein
MVKFYADVNSPSYITEVDKLCAALKSLYKGPSEKRYRPSVRRGMRLPESSIGLFESYLENPQPEGAPLSSPQV